MRRVRAEGPPLTPLGQGPLSLSWLLQQQLRGCEEVGGGRGGALHRRARAMRVTPAHPPHFPSLSPGARWAPEWAPHLVWS